MVATIAPVGRGGIGRTQASATSTSFNLSDIYSTALTSTVVPFNARVGDYIIATLYYQSTVAPGTTPPTCTGPETMTQLGTYATIAANTYAACWGGFVDSLMDDAQVSFTAPATISTIIGSIQVYRGVDPSTPIDVTTTQTTTSATTSHASASITPTTDGAYVVVAAAVNNDNGSGLTPMNTPSGWNLDLATATTAGNDGAVHYVGKTINPAAATTVTLTSSGSVSAALFSVALRPASAQNPIDEIFVGRSALLVFTNSSGGWTKTGVLPAEGGNRLPYDANDLIVWCANYTDATPGSVTISVPSGQGWVAVNATAPWCYVAPYNASIVFPDVIAAGTTDKFWMFTLIIRDVDLNDPFDVVSSTINAAGSTTIVYPDATPTLDDAIVIRLGYISNDTPSPTTAPTDGVPIIGNTVAWQTATGTDCGTFIVLDSLSGGAGVPLGTDSFTMDAAVNYDTQTIVLNRAPERVYLASEVVLGDAELTSGLVAGASSAVFFTSTVEVGAVVVETSLNARSPRRMAARRAFLWHTGPSGRTGVVS